MEQIIISVLVSSGVIGIVANYGVSAFKWLASNYQANLNPRVLNALISLASSVGLIATNKEVDMASVEGALTVLATALIGAIFAHFTHKTNKV